jgi:DNA polymerase-3 subunit beta
LAATDLEQFVSVVGAVAVEEEGTIVVPGRLFGDILRSLPPGKVTVEGNDGEVRISSGRSEFSVNGFPVSDFPVLPEVGDGAISTLAGSELARALRQVVRAAGTDEARPVLTGVLWVIEGGTLRLVSTDSYRLAVREMLVKEGPAEGRAIVPGRALAEFARHLAGVGEGEASVVLGSNQAAFSAGPVRLVTRLIEGEFPNYRQLLPQGYTNRLTVEKEGFLEAVQRIGLVAQANTPLKVHLGPEIQITAVEAGVAEASEVVAGEYGGEPMVMAFNPRFLADGLEGVEAERVVVEAADPHKPAVVKGADDESFIYLLMPVRLAR